MENRVGALGVRSWLWRGRAQMRADFHLNGALLRNCESRAYAPTRSGLPDERNCLAGNFFN